MIKKLSIIILIIFIINIFQSIHLSNSASAKEMLKINSVSFDNSDSIIFLGTAGLKSLEPLTANKVKLSNPDRVYFDIEDAVLTKPNTAYSISNSNLEQLKIAQFSTNPNIVRIVITYKNLNPDKIKLLRHDNNLIIQYNNTTPNQNHLTQIYREIKSGSNDLNETAKAAEVLPLENTLSQDSNEVVIQIQHAFKEPPSVSVAEPVRANPPIKESKLRSRYFIDKLFIKQGNILISGIGIINLEKPIYLTEPSRVVFDFANTVVAQDLRNKEVKINERETVRIGQFEPTKARVVIITPTPQKYRPIFAYDMQNLLLAHDDRMEGVKLSNSLAQIVSINAKQIDSATDNLTIDFSSPVVHSIKRDPAGNKLELCIYNSRYSADTYKEQVRNTPLSASKLDIISNQGFRISIPVDKDAGIEYYENLNATKLHLILKSPPVVKKPASSKNPSSSIPQSVRGKIVVLDPGHGGADTGALKAGIAEKDINLDIAKKLAAILTNNGIAIEMVRWDDATVSLQDRVTFSNSKKTDLFVSLHINSSVKPEIKGIETHYYTETGFEAAKIIHKSIIEGVGGADRGLFKSKFYVINHAEAPSVLLELGFLSNDTERNALLTEERKQKSAEAIAEGIINYLKSQPKQ